MLLFDDDEPAFRARLGKAQNKVRSISPRSRGSFRGKGRHVRPSPQAHQRVIVKMTSHKLSGNGAAKAKAHLNYLQREGAGTPDQAPQLFNKDQDHEPDADEFFRRCEDDRHQFRVILSPENGHMLDLPEYTRAVMEQMEHDVDSELDWVAVEHHNTDNPHVHLVIRGVNEQDQDLFLKRDYITQGLRDRAREIATSDPKLGLGPRTAQQIHAAKQRETTQNRLTSLDYELMRAADAQGRIQPQVLTEQNPQPEAQHLLRQRLGHLENLGLMDSSRTHWKLHPDMKESLRDLEKRNDIIRRMHSAGRERSSDWRTEPPRDQVLCRVAHRGLADETRDDQYLIADGVDGRTYYLDDDQDLITNASPGAVISVGEAAPNGREAVQSADRIDDLVSYPGPTFLDHPDTKRQLDDPASRGSLAHELRAQRARREKFLRRELKIPFDGQSPSYPHLRDAELSHHTRALAQKYGGTPTHPLPEGKHRVEFLGQKQLQAGNYHICRTEDDRVALVPDDKWARQAAQSNEPLSVNITQKDGRRRHFYDLSGRNSERNTDPDKGMDR